MLEKADPLHTFFVWIKRSPLTGTFYCESKPQLLESTRNDSQSIFFKKTNICNKYLVESCFENLRAFSMVTSRRRCIHNDRFYARLRQPEQPLSEISTTNACLHACMHACTVHKQKRQTERHNGRITLHYLPVASRQELVHTQSRCTSCVSSSTNVGYTEKRRPGLAKFRWKKRSSASVLPELLLLP